MEPNSHIGGSPPPSRRSASPYGAIWRTIDAYDAVARGSCTELSNISMQNDRSFHHNARERFIELLPTANRRLLDIGCGTGRDIVAFAQEGAECMGIDGSSTMLADAAQAVQNRTEDYGWARMALPWLGFRPRTFGGVWSSGVLYHLPQEIFDRVIGELRRILVDDGALFCSLKIGRGEWLDSDGEFHGAPRYFAYHTEPELRQTLHTHGFRIQTLLAPRERFIGDHWLYAWAKKR